MPSIIGLDFETYGAVDLPTYGLDRYINEGDTFTTLIASTYHEEFDGPVRKTFDFVEDYFVSAKTGLLDQLGNCDFVGAHNASFEEAVLNWLSPGMFAPHRFIDSAVVARCAGAGSRLEAAAPQLLDVDKMEEGRQLMRLFSIWKEGNPLTFDPQVVRDHPAEWKQYKEYCDLDAELGYRIIKGWSSILGENEHEYDALTRQMNQYGWTVDLDTVHEMQRRFENNKEQALDWFRSAYEQGADAKDCLNFNSFPQLKEFCAKRGVKAKSFDSDHVAALLAKITERIENPPVKATTQHIFDLMEVKDMLRTKQTLGGSSLSKLQKIIDLVGVDGRLRGSYMHVGAGTTLRTTGKGVQMQNLKRLTDVADMAELDDIDAEWDNDKLAENLRQAFVSSDPQGQLVVGDFSSVESRGLGYLAGATWKMNSYANGDDLYKVLASKIYNVSYADVTKGQRQVGKVGELSCGYGAGPGAVKDFAAKMGVTFTEGEAGQLVTDWRHTNPEVVKLWDTLNDLLLAIVGGRTHVVAAIGNRMRVAFYHTATPMSLQRQHPRSQSVAMELLDADGEVVLTRVFHGCYMRGKDVCYYKPASNKTGALWSSHYKHPKTGEIVWFKLYGGKLSGILTQSLCREMFFHSLALLNRRLRAYDNVDIVGQFHDEIVVDWRPGTHPERRMSLEVLLSAMDRAMSDSQLAGFPLAADIKHDYRYIK